MSLLDKASLIVTPNAVKESKLYSVVPSSGAGDMDVVRATTATRVNSAGLIEVVPRNLLTYSEQFDNAAWTKNAATISANSIAAPNGFTTADKLVEDTTNDAHYLDIRPTVNNSINISSIYVKAAGRTKFQLREGSNGDLATFDLSSPSGNIQSVGNDWYRVWLSTTPAATTYIFQLRLLDNSGNLIYTGNGTSGLYVWGAQLEIGSTATEYFPTTTRLNIPRIDYTNGSCPSLLVEPQRTNSCLYSQEISNSVWTKDNLSLTANAITSPSGVQNADLLKETTANSQHRIYQNAVSTILGEPITFSAYAKYGGRQYIYLRVDDGSGNKIAFFDVQNGLVSTLSSGVTASIENAGNGWYRCIMSVPSVTLLATAEGLIGLANSTTFPSIYVGNTSIGVYLWGIQIETNSKYATSYIPTVASSVTRNADVISKTGISSLIGQTEGTIFLDVNFKNLNQVGGVDTLLTLNNGTTANEISILLDTPSGANKTILGYIRNASSNEVVLYAASPITATRYKIALSYKLNDVVLYVNGTQIGTDTSAAIPTTSVVSLNSRSDGSFLNTQQDYIQSAQLYKTRLTNTELAQLTTI